MFTGLCGPSRHVGIDALERREEVGWVHGPVSVLVDVIRDTDRWFETYRAALGLPVGEAPRELVALCL